MASAITLPIREKRTVGEKLEKRGGKKDEKIMKKKETKKTMEGKIMKKEATKNPEMQQKMEEIKRMMAEIRKKKEAEMEGKEEDIEKWSTKEEDRPTSTKRVKHSHQEPTPHRLPQQHLEHFQHLQHLQYLQQHLPEHLEQHAQNLQQHFHNNTHQLQQPAQVGHNRKEEGETIKKTEIKKDRDPEMERKMEQIKKMMEEMRKKKEAQIEGNDDEMEKWWTTEVVYSTSTNCIQYSQPEPTPQRLPQPHLQHLQEHLEQHYRSLQQHIRNNIHQLQQPAQIGQKRKREE